MTNEEVTQVLKNLKNQYGVGDEGDPNAVPRYWNHTPGTANDPTSVTTTSCNHSNHVHYDDIGNLIVDGLCGCNAYGGSIQCYAFSLYLANVVFGANFTVSVAGQPHGKILDGGWKVCKSLSGEKLEPGDVFRFYSTWGEHSAMVWEVSEDGTSVTVAECWGGSGCKLHWGRVNGKDEDSLISNISAGLIFLLKAPKTPTPDTGGDDSGADEENTPKVPVTFKKNTQSDGGPVIETRDYEVGKPYGSFPSSGARTGYSFAGWWPEANSESSEFTVDTIVPAWDHPLYAHWDANQYDLWLYPNYGEDNPAHYKVTYDQPYGTALDGISREGYTFNGWRTERTGDDSSRYETSDIVKATYPHSLYAHWTANTYDVTLNKNDRTNVSNTESFVFGGTYGEKLGALEDRYGYTFKEWNTSPDGEGDSYNENSLIEAKNLDLYAIWEEKEVKVNYNYGYEVNGTVKTGEGTLNYGDTYAEASGTNVPNMTDLEHPTGGYEFAGWHHDVVDGSDKVVMDADHTLTAVWEPKKIIVTFRPDDTNSFKHPISTIQVRYGDKFDQLPIPDPILPYKFIGWTLSEDGENTGTYVDDFEDVYFTEDITLMANWSTRRFVRFIYENENGEETTKSCSQVYGHAYRGVPAIPEKVGYTSKWVFSEEGSVYDGAQFFPGMLAIPEHPNTIKAVYTAKDIPITYDIRGGIIVIGEYEFDTWEFVLQEYGTLYDNLEAKKEDYVFTGWYYDEACTQPVGSTDVITNPEPHTIYAGWKRVAVNLIFDPGDSAFATSVDPIKVRIGEPYGDLPVPKSADNYLFYCWVETNENGDIIDSEKVVYNEQDHTAVAIWSTFRYLVLNPNGGTCSIGIRSVTFGNMYPILPIPTREGYTFDGWYFLNEDGTFGTKCERKEELIVLPEHPDTVYAKWIPVNVTVTFNGMGGTPAFSSYVHSYGSKYVLPYAIRTGYTFNGWFFDESCTKPCTVDNIVTNAEDHILYAGWSIDEDENNIE